MRDEKGMLHYFKYKMAREVFLMVIVPYNLHQ